MPIIKFDVCPDCGMKTWHEQVCYGTSGQMYWTCRGCGNKRECHRLSIDSGGVGVIGKIQIGMKSHAVVIENISRRGARLRVMNNDCPSVKPDDIILFNPKLQPFGQLGSYVQAMVRWVSDRDFGILFKNPLFGSDDELVRVIKRA